MSNPARSFARSLCGWGPLWRKTEAFTWGPSLALQSHLSYDTTGHAWGLVFIDSGLLNYMFGKWIYKTNQPWAMHQCSLHCGHHSFTPVLHYRQQEQAPGLLSPSQDMELLHMQIPGSWAHIKSPAHWKVREKQWEQKVTCDLNVIHFIWSTTKSCVFSTGIYPTALMTARHLSTSQKIHLIFSHHENLFFSLKNKIK